MLLCLLLICYALVLWLYSFGCCLLVSRLGFVLVVIAVCGFALVVWVGVTWLLVYS